MADCIFCKIIAGAIPCAKVYESDHALVFKDLSPKAPIHLLAIPKKHFAHLHEIPADQSAIYQELFAAVSVTVLQEGLDRQGGYRLVVNSGEIGGQAVAHIHVHILAGRALSWPPG
jgi:histidine triad (HIT) family protein